MGSAKRYARAIIFRAPMGVWDALLAVAAGAAGVVSIYALLLKPSDPAAFQFVWWVGLLACGLIFARGLLALMLAARANSDIPKWWLVKVLPFWFRSPIVMKERTKTSPPYGILDFEKGVKDARRNLTKVTERLNKDINGWTETLRADLPELDRVQGAPVERRLRVTRGGAYRMDRYAARMEGHERALRVEATRFGGNYLSRLERLGPGLAVIGAKPDFGPSRAEITQLRLLFTDVRSVAEANRQAVIKMRQGEIERYQNEAADRLIAVMTQVVQDYDAVLAFTQEGLALMKANQPKPDNPAGASNASRPAPRSPRRSRRGR